jgi:hypothetical protein
VHGYPVEHHDLVADELVHRAAMGNGHGGHLPEEVVDHGGDLLGFEAVGECRETHHVGE